MNQHAKQLGVSLATVALMVLLAVRTNGYFTAANLTDLFFSTMPVMIIAVGMTLVILTGRIDISVGSVFAVASVVMGSCVISGVPVMISALIACIIGAACGAVNGALTAYLGIPSVVVTLATMVALRDALRWRTQGRWISALPENFQRFGLSPAGYLTLCIALVLVLLAASAYGLRSLRPGRLIFATGSNEVAATMMGIPTRRVIFSVFTLLGALSGLAAALNAARFNQIPSNLGLGLEIKVIAAVAIGGAEINGGSASILGTFLGVVLLGCISSALTFLHISPYWEKAIQGVIILVAVSSDAVQLLRPRSAGAH